MIKFCLEQWDKNKLRLEQTLRNDPTLNSCDYKHLVELVVDNVFNEDGSNAMRTWDSKNITVIDNGDYQGTLLFLIPLNTYQPTADEYLMTYVFYGSCSGCDALLSLQGLPSIQQPSKAQIKGFMYLCKDLVCNTIRPYNKGYAYEADYDEVSW